MLQSHLREDGLNPNEGDVLNPCQVRGEVAATPPIYLGSGANFGPKIMFPQEQALIPTHFAHSQNFFSKIYKKIGENWKPTKNC